MIIEAKSRDTVLIVDDSPETLRMLTDALDGAGMTVMVALDGASALRIGEQIVPVGKQLLNGTAFVAACDKEKAVSHVFGQQPGRQVKDKDHS